MAGGAGAARLGVLGLVLALGVVSAGCMVQDRPGSEAFSVVADAGESRVLSSGATAHLDFPENRTLEAAGGAVAGVVVAYSWKASWGPNGTHPAFDASPPDTGLSIVELNVTAKDHTASDAVGLLVVPGGAVGGLRIQVGLVGGADLEALAGSPALSKAVVRAGAEEGGSYEAAFPPSGPARYHLVPRAAAGGPGVVILLAVKPGPVAALGNASQPLALDPSMNYTLVVDTTAAQQHRIEVRDGAGTLVESLSLDAFAAAHPGAKEARVQVAPAGQKLPGFEAVAGAGALVGVAQVKLSRRR